MRREREILVGKIWHRSQVSFQAISQANDVAGEMTAVRQAIVDELDAPLAGRKAAHAATG